MEQSESSLCKIPSIVLLFSGVGTNVTSIINETTKTEGILFNKCHLSLVLGDHPDTLKTLHFASSLKFSTFYFPRTKFCHHYNSKSLYNETLLQIIKLMNPDLIVLAGYKYLLPKNFVEAYPSRIINIHPANPKLYKGCGGYKWAFNQKMKKTTLTVHYVDEGIDSGEIISSLDIDLSEAYSLENYIQLGKNYENSFYPKVICSVLNNIKNQTQ